MQLVLGFFILCNALWTKYKKIFKHINYTMAPEKFFLHKGPQDRRYGPACTAVGSVYLPFPRICISQNVTSIMQ